MNQVIVTYPDGRKERYDSQKKVAEHLKASIQHVSYAVKHGYRVKGCIVKLEGHEDDPQRQVRKYVKKPKETKPNDAYAIKRLMVQWYVHQTKYRIDSDAFVEMWKYIEDVCER